MIFGKKCMVVSADTHEGKEGKVYGAIMLSDGKDALKFDCDALICSKVEPFKEYDCFVELSEQTYGDKVYSRRRLIEVRQPDKAASK